MNIVTFDCRNCGAPLDVPDNACAVICPFCKSHHKMAFSDGILTAGLTKVVQAHGKQISELESSDMQTQDALEALTELADCEKG